jgi:hypothetical protein
MRVIFALVAEVSAVSTIGMGAAEAQQQTKLQQLMPQLTPQQREQLKRLTPQQRQELEMRLQLSERYRGWSMTAKGFNNYDHCMRTTGKWTYRC